MNSVCSITLAPNFSGNENLAYVTFSDCLCHLPTVVWVCLEWGFCRSFKCTLSCKKNFAGAIFQTSMERNCKKLQTTAVPSSKCLEKYSANSNSTVNTLHFWWTFSLCYGYNIKSLSGATWILPFGRNQFLLAGVNTFFLFSMGVMSYKNIWIIWTFYQV